MNTNPILDNNSSKNSRRKFMEKLGVGSLLVGIGGNQCFASVPGDYEKTKRKNQEHVWDPYNFGAKGDGRTLDTKSIQTAIDNCHLNGGGTVHFKNGTFLSGTIYLKSHVTLFIEAGAILKASSEEINYQFSGHSEEGYPEKYYYLIVAEKQEHVSILGQGMILGIGENDLGRRRDQIKVSTPYRIGILYFNECRQIVVRDIKILFSDFWTLHFYLCERIFIEGVSILNNYYHTNSDGIDPVSCKNVFISNCLIVAGDDCVCPKTKNGFPCENVVVTNCILESVATAIKLGTGSDGDFRDMHFSNCTIRNSGVGIGFFIKDGGRAERITFSNISIETTRDLSQITDGLINTITPIFLDIEKRYEYSLIGSIRDITFRDIHINSGANCLVQGMPESPIENLIFENITIRVNETMDFTKRNKRSGGYTSIKDDRLTKYIRQPTYFSIAYVNDLRMSNIRVLLTENAFEQFDRSAVALFEIRRGMIQHINRQPAGNITKRQSILNLNNCQSIFITGCFAIPDTNSFIQIEGENSTDISISGNDLRNSKEPVKIIDITASKVRYDD